VIKILLAGEGANELGRWSAPPAPPAPREGDGEGAGVLEAFLGKVSPGGWRIETSVPWKGMGAALLERT